MSDQANVLGQAQGCADMVLFMLEDTVRDVEMSALQDDTRQRTLRGLLRTGQALDSARVLAELARFEDVWVLTRVLCEAAINVTYLLIASEEERMRWTNFDRFMDRKWIQNLSGFLDVRQLYGEQIVEAIEGEHRRLMEHGLFHEKQSSWSEKNLPSRAAFIDKHMNREIGVFTLLYRNAVKQGDCFVHSSPKAFEEQTHPLGSRKRTNSLDLRTAQALAIACTGCYAVLSAVQLHYALNEHGLARKFRDQMERVYAATTSDALSTLEKHR